LELDPCGSIIVHLNPMLLAGGQYFVNIRVHHEDRQIYEAERACPFFAARRRIPMQQQIEIWQPATVFAVARAEGVESDGSRVLS
jgi:hypothetical protein